VDQAVEISAEVNLGKRKCPPLNGSILKLYDYKADALLATMNSSLKAGLLRRMKPRIMRLIRRKWVYESVLRLHRAFVRRNREKCLRRSGPLSRWARSPARSRP
jgi:hypothetical protein